MNSNKTGALRGDRFQKRKQPGINLPTDYMTDEEIAELSSEVTTYYVEVKECK